MNIEVLIVLVFAKIQKNVVFTTKKAKNV